MKLNNIPTDISKFDQRAVFERVWNWKAPNKCILNSDELAMYMLLLTNEYWSHTNPNIIAVDLYHALDYLAEMEVKDDYLVELLESLETKKLLDYSILKVFDQSIIIADLKQLRSVN
ncbi:hypothetical protein G3570_03175 [Balneolaceae bacterium YR4-1]|uniref:Uncharacterized protein n=1 Tax=Halalkalibaculum roseum TaxID=2709311 RepID=A0A6M1SKU0_9BACT|nr:hypothetical protein [Halalkalibaculum roseum]NGP75619.1 hypothetical protein [Halalkalibaculum roseum]